MRDDYAASRKLLEEKTLLNEACRKQVMEKEFEQGARANAKKAWEPATHVRVGSLLLELLISVAKVPVNRDVPSILAFPGMGGNRLSSPAPGSTILVQALEHKYRMKDGKRHGVIAMHESIGRALHRGLTESSGNQFYLIPGLLPMVIPPKPWLTYNSGGYLSIKSLFELLEWNCTDACCLANCLRGITPQTEAYLNEGSLKQTLNSVFAGLDALGNTPWEINDGLLRHMIRAWNTGEAIAGLPADLSDSIPVPDKPPDFEENPFSRYQWHKQKQKMRQEYFDQKGLRATENYKLEIARAVRSIAMPRVLSLSFEVLRSNDIFSA